ncbi:MAG: OadG family transporter subunit [Rikenellaceae bacterium]
MSKKIFLILCAFTLSLTAVGQGLRDVKINEILVKNVDSYSNDYGHKVGWIELYNSGFTGANVANAHLRLISRGDTITYKIPSNDARTYIAPQGYTVFFADGSSNRGTFYTNFMLGDLDSTEIRSSKAVIERLELLDQSGKLVIDSIIYDVKTQREDISYGRLESEVEGEFLYTALSHNTPMQTNETNVKPKKSEVFRERDPNGFAMAITAMSVVFTALLCLFLVFRFVGSQMKARTKAKAKKEAAASGAPVAAKSPAKSDELTGETIAAIAIAINLFEEELHDIESNVVTINKVARAYSPWSSKIYGLRNELIKK